MYYKLEQACVTNCGSFVLLQIRANVVTNWGSFIITNWGKCCYKLGQLLQIRATVITIRATITNWGKMYYKLGQVLQIRAIIKNWSITPNGIVVNMPEFQFSDLRLQLGRIWFTLWYFDIVNLLLKSNGGMGGGEGEAEGLMLLFL